MRDHSTINNLNQQSQSTISIDNLNQQSQSTIDNQEIRSLQSSIINGFRSSSLPGNRPEGEQPPVVRRAAGPKSSGGDGGSRRAAGPCSDGADRTRAWGRGRMAAGSRTARARVWRRPFRPGWSRAARRRRDRGGNSDRSRWPAGSSNVPGLGAPSGQAIPAHLATDRTRGRRPHQRGQGMESRSERSRVHDPRGGAHRRCVLLFWEGTRRRWNAGWRQREGRVPPLWGDRFAGRGLAADAPWVPGSSDPFSQLPDPVASVAGKNTRAGTASRAVSVSLAAVPRPVW